MRTLPLISGITVERESQDTGNTLTHDKQPKTIFFVFILKSSRDLVRMKKKANKKEADFPIKPDPHNPLLRLLVRACKG